MDTNRWPKHRQALKKWSSNKHIRRDEPGEPAGHTLSYGFYVRSLHRSIRQAGRGPRRIVRFVEGTSTSIFFRRSLQSGSLDARQHSGGQIARTRGQIQFKSCIRRRSTEYAAVVVSNRRQLVLWAFVIRLDINCLGFWWKLHKLERMNVCVYTSVGGSNHHR